MDNSSLPRTLLIATAALMFLLVFGNYLMNQTGSGMRNVDTQNQPTLGNPNALVQVLVIEEPKCPNCKAYNTLTFPQIKKDFIDTGKIQYTTLVVSFSEASLPAAQALLCAFYQDKDNPDDSLFYDFLHETYRRSGAEDSTQNLKEILLATAQKSNPSIDIEKLRTCMDREVYYTQIMRNTEIAKSMLGKSHTTPAIFINGVRTSGISSNTIKEAIESALNKVETVENN